MAKISPTDRKSPRDSLILLARPPFPGRVKTRLIPHLGEEGAASLYRAFLADAAAMAQSVRAARPTVGIFVEWAAEKETLGEFASELNSPAAYLPGEWLPGPFLHRAQTGGGLGERMAAALGRRLAFGDRAVLIGTDFPDLAPEIILSAFEGLERMELESPTTPRAVLGPASDGGYYLVGLTLPAPSIFTGIEWGTKGVFEATLQKLKTLDFRVHLLPEWRDVDTPDDLAALRARLDGAAMDVAVHTRGALL